MTKRSAKKAVDEVVQDTAEAVQSAEASVKAATQDVVAEPEKPEVLPTWFSRTYGETSPAHMAEAYARSHAAPFVAPVRVEGTAAYEAYRRRLEERTARNQLLSDPDSRLYGAMPMLPDATFPQRPRVVRALPGQVFAEQRYRRTFGLHPSVLALATLAACALGSGLGYVIANPEQVRSFSLQVASIWSAPHKSPTETVIEKKPMRSTKIEVRNAAGAINSPIPLDISALPADEHTPVAFRITGLPPSAYLTKGYEISKGEWMLKAGDLAHAELVVPHTTRPELDLQVSALEEKTGKPAAPAQSFTVTLDTNAVPVPGVPQQPKADPPIIVPASAQPDQGFNKAPLPAAVPAPIESVNPEVQNLIVKGDTLLDNGDILAARQFYLRAYQLKAVSAAYGVGQTYDPAVFAKHNVTGVEPNIQTAAEWYGKAAAAGSEAATRALAALPVRP